jgi:hypothetical protein
MSGSQERAIWCADSDGVEGGALVEDGGIDGAEMGSAANISNGGGGRKRKPIRKKERTYRGGNSH